MRCHTLRPGSDTLHGDFQRDRPACLIIDSGDRLVVDTLDVGWGCRPMGEPDRKYSPRQDGPALCGPVAVRGARPGMTLEIVIESVVPAAWGWTLAGGPGFFNQAFNRQLGVCDWEPYCLTWQLAGDEGLSATGHRVRLRPFLGMLGMPEDRPGSQSAWTPRVTGGNLDCAALIAGTRLYLPVQVEGGLLSMGDAHARQGDGELSGTAIECCARTTMRVRVRPGPPPPGPRLVTRREILTLGVSEDLQEAGARATRAMVDWLAERLGVSPVQALALASAVVDLRVTQVVNGVVGAQAAISRKDLALLTRRS